MHYTGPGHDEHDGHITSRYLTHTELLGEQIVVVNKKYDPFPALDPRGDNTAWMIAVRKIVHKESSPYLATQIRATFQIAIDCGDFTEASADDLLLLSGSITAICTDVGIAGARIAVAECSCVVVSGELQSDDNMNIEPPW